MATKVKVSITIPELWTVRDSQITALDTIALVRSRVYAGKDTNDRSFKGYSERPIYISYQANLPPKGGEKTPKGVYYKGGYREYKQKSRRYTPGGKNQTAEVDLTLSGALMNNLITTNATKTSYTIGLSSKVQSYGYDVNRDRSFIGLSPSDQRKLTNAIAARMRKKLSPIGYGYAEQKSVIASINRAIGGRK
jgi:hypothetical protein